MPIAVFGSINQDLVTYTKKFPGPGETIHGVSFERHLGGKGFNEAIACAKLKSPNDKFSVNLFGSIGLNDSSDFLNYLLKNNININYLNKVNNISTGTATIIVIDDNNKNAENRIIVVPGANNHFNPSIDDLNNFFNPSNNLLSIDNNNNTNITNTANPISPTGLINKNGSIIHDSSSTNNLNNIINPINSFSSPLNSSSTTFYNNNNNKSSYDQLLNGSSLHSHSTENIMSSRITNSYSDLNLPSELNAHASIPKLDTLTYPSPKPSAIDLQNTAIALASKAPIPNKNSNSSSNLNLTAQNRLTNVSFSLGGSSAHSSSTSLNPCQSYLNLINRSRQNSISKNNLIPSILTNFDNNDNDLNYFAILQNEIPNPYFIINHINKNFKNVKIFYNPSPLPIKKIDFNNEFFNALHQSNYLIINEHELKGLIDNFHSDPNRNPLSNLKNNSNFEPNSEFLNIVNENIINLTKLRSLLTKPVIIVTLGSAGVLYSDVGKFIYSYIPAEDVDYDEIVDTTGAGDTFLGAIVTCIYRNESLESAIKFATKASAETIKGKGSAESIPYYKNIEKRGWLL
ncbi:hypothetical protein C6P42_002679 [Pichia californica]|nr:hypothetical protein C6P42_002679 [[Candida] californica]